MAFIETSAFEKINIDKAFKQMVEEIYKKYQKNFEDYLDEEELGNAENAFEIKQQQQPPKNNKTKLKEAKDKLKKNCCK